MSDTSDLDARLAIFTAIEELNPDHRVIDSDFVIRLSTYLYGKRPTPQDLDTLGKVIIEHISLRHAEQLNGVDKAFEQLALLLRPHDDA